jgi:hypothetical protein
VISLDSFRFLGLIGIPYALTKAGKRLGISVMPGPFASTLATSRTINGPDHPRSEESVACNVVVITIEVIVLVNPADDRSGKEVESMGSGSLLLRSYRPADRTFEHPYRCTIQRCRVGKCHDDNR